MNRFSVLLVRGTALALLAGTAVITAALVNPAFAVNCKRNPTHPDCQPTGDDPDRIAGCVTLAEPAGGFGVFPDGVEPYCDGESTKDGANGNTLMQVAMNCQFNHFNLYVGGGLATGGRHVDLVLGTEIPTTIESCKMGGVQADVTYKDVEWVTTMFDCDESNPDWAFNQLLRTRPGGGVAATPADGTFT
jgi:hypothetical protein